MAPYSSPWIIFITVALLYPGTVHESSLRARGGSTAAERRHISDRGVQLKVLPVLIIFAENMENTVL